MEKREETRNELIEITKGLYQAVRERVQMNGKKSDDSKSRTEQNEATALTR